MQMSLWNTSSLRVQLRTFVRGWSKETNRAPKNRPALLPANPCGPAATSTSNTHLPDSTVRAANPLRPLRIMRVQEAGQAGAASSRMVLSGRMVDVCAELDRLAACEALLH